MNNRLRRLSLWILSLADPFLLISYATKRWHDISLLRSLSCYFLFDKRWFSSLFEWLTFDGFVGRDWFRVDNDGFSFFRFRLNPGLIGNPQLGVTPATPLMPVFPLRAPPANYSPYSPSRFHIDKRCQHRCTWKCFSIALILLSLILTALLAYFGAVSSMKTGLDTTTCILVEDAKAVSQDGVDNVISSQSPTAGKCRNLSKPEKVAWEIAFLFPIIFAF